MDKTGVLGKVWAGIYISGSRQPVDRMSSPCRQGREKAHSLSPRATQPSGTREMRGNQKKMEKNS